MEPGAHLVCGWTAEEVKVATDRGGEGGSLQQGWTPSIRFADHNKMLKIIDDKNDADLGGEGGSITNTIRFADHNESFNDYWW